MNKVELKYDVDNLEITQHGYENKLAKKTESIFNQGNSYIGIRAVDEEYNYLHKEDFFLAGFYNKGDDNEESELANLANSIQNEIYIDGEFLVFNNQDDYSKTLELKSGQIKRVVTFSRNQKKYRFSYYKNVSQSFKHLFAQKFVFEQLEGEDSEIIIMPHINGSSNNNGVMHFKEGIKKLYSENLVQYQYQSTKSKQHVIQNLQVRVYNDNKEHPYKDNDDFVLFMKRRNIGFKVRFILKSNTSAVIEKLMSVNSSQDELPKSLNIKDVIKKSYELAEVLKKTSYEQIQAENLVTWESIFRQWEVDIIGESYNAKYDRLALYYSINQMNTFIPKYSDHYGIAAKGLSGEGYQGHNYWDSELFILPNLIFTDPARARQYLKYRYLGLNGARRKAQEKKHIGAQYPWETSLPHEGEVTPYWGQPDIKTGKQVPIASRAQEIHVSADVAYAVEQYYRVTDDQEFMNEYGYEMIIDTAIWWSQRAEYNPKLDIYVITDVMGPNEYKGNIDNNAFINRMAKFNLDIAIEYIKDLEANSSELLVKINNKIPYPYKLEDLENVANKLKQQSLTSEGILPENDTYLNLEKKNISDFKLRGDAGKKLFNTAEGISKLSGQLTKQADVVLINWLFKDNLTVKDLQKNWDFYENSTTHDSSLSPSTYAISAIEYRHRLDYAYDLFKYAINIDLGSNFHSSDTGIHSGALAATFQMIVFGYGGLKYYNRKLYLNPLLAPDWDGLNYTIKYKNSNLNIKITKTNFTVEADKEVELIIYNQPYKIQKLQTFEIK
ncbi:glycosyl hydrolase family 65 protein [Mycoplasmopsis agassizii]|uniref:glycosyl hydrolase family 65 protein n=1 Tax=Mycoplasmopsis agassizii TaxID=33922 RepID=UPI00352860C8